MNVDRSGHESFLWENQSWVFSNSDNSGGPDGEPGKKLPDSGSNTQTPTGIEVAPCGKKRSGINKKGGKGSCTDHEINGEKGGHGGGGGESDDHEMHIWTERERRKKMRNMFSNLHALLPQLPPKADKSTIVDEAVSYIKTLQQTLQKLQKQKLERLQGVTTMNFDQSSIITQQNLAMNSREAFLADQGSSIITPTNPSNSLSAPRVNPPVFKTWTSPNVVLTVCGDQAQITVCFPKKLGILTALCYVLEKHKMEVLSAHVSSHHNLSIYMIQAHASAAPNQFPEAFPVEEIYKQAAGEIMYCISSGLCQQIL